MATYKSSYTGPQIDQAVSHAVNMDVNPTAGHTDRVVSSGGVKSAINSSDACVGIVETGDNATQNISSGQYVIWKGTLYTANQGISSGAALSGKLTAVSNGGLNDVKSTLVNRLGDLRCISKSNNTGSGVTLTFDLNGTGVGIMFVQAAGTEGAIYGLTVLDAVTATRLVGSYSPTISGSNPRSFSINVGAWANVTILCTRSGWSA